MPASPAIRFPHSRAAGVLLSVLAASVVAACGGGGAAKAPATATSPGVPLAQAGVAGQAAAAVALRYAVADARGRGALTCRLVAAQLASALDKLPGGCARALSHRPVPLAETSVSRVAVTGASAIAVLPDPGHPPRQIALLQQGQRWQVVNGGT